MTRKKAQPVARPARTNAERTSATRGKLIDAAIDILYREGYSATTTLEVAKQARVSRGAMLHQFPTRVKLLLAVAEHIVNSQRELRGAKLGALTGMARFNAASDVSWEVQKQPSTIALLEIMMASRSDRALRVGLAPFFLLLPQMRKQAATNMAADLGIAEVPQSAAVLDDMLHIHLAALRGLAIELLFTQNTQEIESARRLLIRYDRSVVEQLLALTKK